MQVIAQTGILQPYAALASKPILVWRSRYRFHDVSTGPWEKEKASLQSMSTDHLKNTVCVWGILYQTKRNGTKMHNNMDDSTAPDCWSEACSTSQFLATKPKTYNVAWEVTVSPTHDWIKHLCYPFSSNVAALRNSSAILDKNQASRRWLQSFDIGS